jgi:signal transduction protein with GAF and PtsI domain
MLELHMRTGDRMQTFVNSGRTESHLHGLYLLAVCPAVQGEGDDQAVESVCGELPSDCLQARAFRALCFHEVSIESGSTLSDDASFH